MNKITKILISSLILVCGGVCFATGCFMKSENITPKKTIQKIEKFKYKNFVNSWNKFLRDPYFATIDTSKLLLPTSQNKEVINKLNNIFNPKRIDIQIFVYQKKLQNDNMIDLPIKEYISFLKNLHFRQNAFNIKQSSQELTKLVLFQLNSDYSYLTLNDMKKLGWTYSFKKFFKDNVKNFLKKGFSENLINYTKYKLLME